MPRVFAGDEVDFFQDAQRAQRNVFEVADGRADDVKATAAGRGSIGGRWDLAWRDLRRPLLGHRKKSSTRAQAPAAYVESDRRVHGILIDSAPGKGECLCLCTSTNA